MRTFLLYFFPIQKLQVFALPGNKTTLHNFLLEEIIMIVFCLFVVVTVRINIYKTELKVNTYKVKVNVM